MSTRNPAAIQKLRNQGYFKMRNPYSFNDETFNNNKDKKNKIGHNGVLTGYVIPDICQRKNNFNGNYNSKLYMKYLTIHNFSKCLKFLILSVVYNHYVNRNITFNTNSYDVKHNTIFVVAE